MRYSKTFICNCNLKMRRLILIFAVLAVVQVTAQSKSNKTEIRTPKMGKIVVSIIACIFFAIISLILFSYFLYCCVICRVVCKKKETQREEFELETRTVILEAD